MTQAIAPLQTALDETDDAVRPVIGLAIAQLQKKQAEEADGWD